MKNKIVFGEQFIDNNDIMSVIKSLKKEKVLNGKLVKKIENKLKLLFKFKYTISYSNGTVGLILAMMSINLKKISKII